MPHLNDPRWKVSADSFEDALVKFGYQIANAILRDGPPKLTLVDQRFVGGDIILDFKGGMMGILARVSVDTSVHGGIHVKAISGAKQTVAFDKILKSDTPSNVIGNLVGKALTGLTV